MVELVNVAVIVNGQGVLASLFLLSYLDDLEFFFYSASLVSFWHLWLSAAICYMNVSSGSSTVSAFIGSTQFPFQGQTFLILDSHPL